MKALSIRQPWVWLIVHGGKDIENRTWRTSYRGPVLIHASKTFDQVVYDAMYLCPELVTPPLPRAIYAQLSRMPARKQFHLGSIIGMADLVDCVTESNSEWFTGPYGFVLENARPLPFKAMRGQLGLFEVQWQRYDDPA